MKRFICILICLLLCACADTSNINEKIDEILDKDEIYNTAQNNYTEFMNYYLPSDVYEDSSSLLTYSFLYNNSKLIMNVNVAGIINDRYYLKYRLKDDGFFDENKLMYSNNGFYHNDENQRVAYFLNIYDYDGSYLIHFMTSNLNMYGYCQIDDLVNLVSRIVLIAKGVEVNKEEVISVYSSRDVIDYQKTQVNLFESVLPVEGRVDELMVDSGLEVSLN